MTWFSFPNTGIWYALVLPGDDRSALLCVLDNSMASLCSERNTHIQNSITAREMKLIIHACITTKSKMEIGNRHLS